MIQTPVHQIAQVRARLETSCAVQRGSLPDLGLFFNQQPLDEARRKELESLRHQREEFESLKDAVWAKLPLDLPAIFEWCQQLDLVSTRAQLERVVMALSKQDKEWALELLPDLWVRLEDELKARLFLAVRPRLASHYSALAPFGEAVQNSFPTCAQDIEEASKCFALERWTGSVFHCMRVLEVGLRSFSRRLHIPKKDYERHNWGTLIDLIEKELEKFKSAKRGTAAHRNLSAYSEAATNFRYFKNAWRNHATHARQHYDEDKAARILVRVGDFMGVLAKIGLKA